MVWYEYNSFDLKVSSHNHKTMMVILALAMDWRSLGAPVSDCKPAPKVERMEPISMTLGWGQATFPMTKLPPMLCPNLRRKEGRMKWNERNRSALLLVSQQKRVHHCSKEEDWGQVHSSSGSNCTDSSDWNGFLSVSQISGSVRPSHDACKLTKMSLLFAGFPGYFPNLWPRGRRFL